MASDDNVIEFKTDAWKSTEMVAGYATRMHENRGTNQLKNRVEVALCRDNVRGRRIADVGVGTGRGSLPLARDGFEVTGIDISQAMLDHCRREAGETPIELLLGDLTALPVESESFDSLISLNVVVHFPNWRDVLRDWARVVRPGGRLVFDVHSFDHLAAVARSRGCEPADLLTQQQREDPGAYMLRIGAHDVAEAAESLGMCVRKLVPYAAVLGGGNANYWLQDSRLWGYLGDRALSWMAVDEQLFSFGSFIEEQMIARLSTGATGRFMVVLEKRHDPAQTRGVLAYQKALDTAFAGGARLESLRAVAGPEVDTWPRALSKHLEHAPNWTLLAMMLSSPVAVRLRPLVEDILGATVAAGLYEGNRLQRIDDHVTAFLQSWRTTVSHPDRFIYRGVDAGRVLEYDLMRDLLEIEHFKGEPSL
ncbi:MAG: class I SAM-dependent methyltransferase [Vulcanimicrobiaceae bacterium]